MQVLLVEPDESRHPRWAERFETESCNMTLASEAQEVQKALAAVPVTTAFVRFPLDWTDNPSELRQLLQASCHYVVAITDGSPSATKQAYADGFVDCLDENCGQVELCSKLTHADHLEQLNQRLAQAQKLESIGELAAGIAHEINTPIQYVGDNTRFVQDSCGELLELLTSCNHLLEQAGDNEPNSIVKKSLQTLLEEADIEYLIEEIPSAIQQTLEGVDRVSNIVRAMKEFAHPGVSEMVPTDLAKAIANTLMVARNEWKYVADSVTEFDPNLPPVPCLPGELNQVLLNIIVNAAHAIGDSLADTPGAKGTIRIATHLRGTHAEIRISDSGTGIAPSDIEQIFTPFFTTKSAGKGTGQGLAIAHSVIVEKHAGEIDVESQLGAGTTFILRLPLESDRSKSAGKQASEADLGNVPTDSLSSSQSLQEA